jgi:hypothetical protein
VEEVIALCQVTVSALAGGTEENYEEHQDIPTRFEPGSSRMQVHINA